MQTGIDAVLCRPDLEHSEARRRRRHLVAMRAGRGAVSRFLGGLLPLRMYAVGNETGRKGASVFGSKRNVDWVAGVHVLRRHHLLDFGKRYGVDDVLLALTSDIDIVNGPNQPSGCPSSGNGDVRQYSPFESKIYELNRFIG